MKNFIKEMCNREYIKAYNKYKNMPKEEKVFEYAYLEANLKIIPVFSIIFSLFIFMFNELKLINPIIVIGLAVLFLVAVINSIAYTSLNMDALKAIDNKFSYSLKTRKNRIR